MPIAKKLFLTTLFPDLKLYPEVVDTYVADTTTKFGRFASIFLYPHKLLDRLDDLQQCTGIYINDVPSKAIRNFTGDDIYFLTLLEGMSEVSTKTEAERIVDNLFSELHPETFRDMVSLFSAALSTFSWEDSVVKNADNLATVIYSSFFKHYPCFTREDFFDFLLDEGIERSLAFEISEQIRKGYASSPKHAQKFCALPIPDELKVVARHYSDIFPRAHCVEFILTYAWITRLYNDAVDASVEYWDKVLS